MKCWITSEKRWGDTEEVSYLVTWYVWRPNLPPSRDDRDPVTDSHEVYHRADTLAEARKVAQREANRLAKTDTGPWYCALITPQTLEQLAGDSFDWSDDEQPEHIEASSKIKTA